MCVLGFAACGGEVTGPNNAGPWLGDWVQVNFLAVDDGGVWDDDIPSGIGFVASISETQWRETDEDGAGCSVTFRYSVNAAHQHSKEPVALGPNCPMIPIEELPPETGRLEFLDDGDTMIEWFDLLPGDEIQAFKWRRR
ncbi:MAG: hypothetical protein R3324_00990 [Halobacteriales archaeon]|nr:hypothetical protein [Halobacteriales archaeon]